MSTKAPPTRRSSSCETFETPTERSQKSVAKAKNAVAMAIERRARQIEKSNLDVSARERDLTKALATHRLADVYERRCVAASSASQRVRLLDARSALAGIEADIGRHQAESVHLIAESKRIQARIDGLRKADMLRPDALDDRTRSVLGADAELKRLVRENDQVIDAMTRSRDEAVEAVQRVERDCVREGMAALTSQPAPEVQHDTTTDANASQIDQQEDSRSKPIEKKQPVHKKRRTKAAPA